MSIDSCRVLIKHHPAERTKLKPCILIEGNAKIDMQITCSLCHRHKAIKWNPIKVMLICFIFQFGLNKYAITGSIEAYF